MTFKNNNRTPRCPKCNEPMRLAKDAPRFAQFLPSQTFNCKPCGVGLTYWDDDEGGDRE